MSRCFPFPPPGYEKKPTPEEDLFREEEGGGEKRHKKEKKSKRKREGDYKEEGNKDRVKQREKKEKKNKHRDKKEKEKVKTKDKDKRNISDDATTAGQRGTSGRDSISMIEEHSNSKSRGFNKNKFASAFRGQNGWSITDNRLRRESEESKFVEELGRRIKDEEKAIGSQTIQRPSTLDRSGYEDIQKAAVTFAQNSAKDMEYRRDQGVDPKKVEGKGHTKVEVKGLKDGLKFNGNNTVQYLTLSIDRKFEMPPELEQRFIETPVQEKDKYIEKSDSKRGEKRKDRDKKEKKSHGKDKKRDKMKKKEKGEEKKREETQKERTEHKKRDQDTSIDLYKNENLSSSRNNNVYSSEADDNIVSTEENVRKVKDVVANGFGHVNEIQSNKLRTQLMNNGKILEDCQSPVLLESYRPCIPVQDTGGTKYHEMNGTVGPQSSCMPNKKPPSVPITRSDQPIVTLEKPLLAITVAEAKKLPQAPVIVEASIEAPLSAKVIETLRRPPQASQIVDTSKKHPRADRITEPSRKPPHPDLKYLNEVLLVPKMEVWSEVDQGWLFSNKDLSLKKQKSHVSVDSRQPHVWSGTLHIESADLYALPYVIPY